MKKNETFVLDNNLRVIMCLDTSKKSCYAELITRFGSRTEGYIKDGKKHIITPGLAHMLEHAIIDTSLYGNAFDHFKNLYVSFNGFTNSRMTSFYINDILDFENNLVKLINIVNNPQFDEASLVETKKPIIEEIRKSNDNRFKNVLDAVKRCAYHNQNKMETLGTEEEVNSITYEELKECHNLFYNPKNQIISIAGNFDPERIKKIIIDTYASLNRTYEDYEEVVLDEPVSINKPSEEIIDNENEEVVMMDFKFSLDKLSNYERVKLSFYMEYFFRYNFRDGSKIYNYMIDNKFSVYSIDVGYRVEKDIAYISLTSFTNHLKEFKDFVLDIMKNIPYDEEEFDIWKKESIIQIILREEHPSKELGPFVDNIITYDYYDVDKIEDVSSCSIEEFKEFFSRLDFTNYTVVSRVKEK